MLINVHIGTNGWKMFLQDLRLLLTLKSFTDAPSSMQDVAQLRKDLNFTQHMLNADYEDKLTKRATELWVY